MERDPWQRYAERSGATLGLGVFPDSRDPLRFVEEIGTGAPTARPGARSVVRGEPGSLGRALRDAGIRVELSASDSRARASLARAFEGATLGAEPGSGRSLQLFDGPMILLGLGEKTPVWIAVCARAPCKEKSAIAAGGIARRPAIVTPYDLAATILDMFDIERTESFIGNPLHADDDSQALDRIRSLASHLERGAGLGATMGASTTLLAIGALFVGLLLRAGGRRRLSSRAGQAAGIAVVGYLVALFVPSGDGTVRALVITAVIVIAAFVGLRDPERGMGRLMLGLAGGFAFIVMVAPLRPGGLPGAAIWGNPLISWRFTGLQNFEVSFLAVAVVVWAVLAGLKPVSLAVVSFVATVIIGAPTVGSNFVGVLTIAFGASLAVFALARRHVELWQALVSVVIASAAFVLSLLADSASPVSHGGRAARRISEGGFSTLVDFVEARLRLNLDLIKSFPVGTGFLLVAMMLAVIASLMVWGAKSGAPRRGRIAAWAGSAMALSSLVLEDSGFYSGAVMLVAAAAAWMTVTASEGEDGLSPSDPAPAGAG